MKVIAFPRMKAEEPEEPAGLPTHVLADDRGGIDRITVRVITLALVLSLFIHLVLLLAPLMSNTKPPTTVADEVGPLQARLEPAPAKPKSQPQPQPQPQPKPDSEPPPVKAVTPPRPTPAPAPPRARIAVPRPSPITVPPPIVSPPAPTPAPAPQAVQPATEQPPAEDLASLIEQRRRARGAPSQDASESDDERAKRIAMGNIQAQQRAASPEMVDGGGGLFMLQRTGLTDAEFVFRGWSTDFKRNTGLTVAVRQGNEPDIRIAVVRRMIQIIRERKPGDFEWYSYKRGKSITMSARPADSARLEAFLMHEFYPEDPRGRDAK